MKPLSLIPAFSLAILLSSCASDYEHLEKLPKNNFVTQNMTEWDKPFTAVWLDSNIKSQKIHSKKIFIKPVTLDYLQPPLNASDESRTENVKKLAAYFDEKLAEKIKASPKATLRVTDSAKKAQFIVEPALVHVERTRYGVNFLTFGTSFVIPWITYAFAPFTEGEMALMVKVSDTKTGKVQAAFADFKTDMPTIFGSVRDFSPYGHHYQTIDIWTEKFSDLIGSDPGEEIKKPTWITLSIF